MSKPKRDIAQEILDGIREIKAGGGKRTAHEVPTGVKLVRAKMGLSQVEFAKCLNIDLNTLQEWERGDTIPALSTLALMDIAAKHPEIFLLAKH